MKKTELEKSERKINKLLSDVFLSFGISCGFFDGDGRQLGYCSYEGRSNFCRFVSFYDTEQVCRKSYLKSFGECRRRGVPYIYFCPYGLVNIAFPVFRRGEEDVFVTVGPMLYRPPENDTISRALERNFLLKPRAREVRQYLNDIPVKNENDVYSMASIIESALRGIVVSRGEGETIAIEGDSLAAAASPGESPGRGGAEPPPFHRWLRRLSAAGGRNGEFPKEELDHWIMVFTDYIFAESDLKTAVNHTLKYIEILTDLTRAARIYPGQLFNPDGIDVEKVLTVQTKDDLETLVLYYNEMFRGVFLAKREAKNKDTVYRAMHYIQNHYGDITLADVAEAVGLNPAYFSNYFKRATGESYSGYLNKVRIEESKRLLMTDCSISEIAQRVGFSDQSYFTNVFKKIEGVSPNRWRKAHEERGENDDTLGKRI
ncbi:MAG: helix-turn-helix domain-containing protein [Bacillota bacterium]|jgi:two-component system response regulator YesN